MKTNSIGDEPPQLFIKLALRNKKTKKMVLIQSELSANCNKL